MSALDMSEAVTVDFVQQRHPVELFGRTLHLRAEELLGRKKHVFCRECANPLAQIYPGHPCVKRLGGVPAYENVYPDAPIYSQYTVEYKQNEYQQHRVERIAAATKRNDENREAHQNSQKTYQRSARGKENARKRRLRRDTKIKEALELLEAKRNQPSDWWEKPDIWRIVADIIRREPGILTKQIALRLDVFAKCDYGQKNGQQLTWLEYSKTRAGEVFFNRVKN